MWSGSSVTGLGGGLVTVRSESKGILSIPTPRLNLASSAICLVENSALVNKAGRSLSDPSEEI